MTIEEILEEVSQRKQCSKRTLFRYLDVLDIQPLGARQRPQHYPEDSAAKVLEHLGLRDATPHKPARVISVNRLLAARAKANRK